MAIFILLTLDHPEMERHKPFTMVTTRLADKAPGLGGSETDRYIWRRIYGMTIGELDAKAEGAAKHGGLKGFKLADKPQYFKSDIDAATKANRDGIVNLLLGRS